MPADYVVMGRKNAQVVAFDEFIQAADDTDAAAAVVAVLAAGKADSAWVETVTHLTLENNDGSAVDVPADLPTQTFTAVGINPATPPAG